MPSWPSWGKPDSGEGRSSLRTCATGILRAQNIDVTRTRGREVHFEPLDAQRMEGAMDALFAKDGHWQDLPPAWLQPESSRVQPQFCEALQTCVNRLPAKVGRVFMRRVWLDKEVDDICPELGITSSHSGVMRHRARVRLCKGAAAGPAWHCGFARNE